MKNLNEVLDEYSKSDMYPFHMPGHKRRVFDEENPYLYDMTEVDGVDDLHDPQEVIKYEEERIKRLYKADKSYILVGGSTVGNLAAIYSCTKDGDNVLIQRNSHKSMYNALEIRHSKVSYLKSRTDENNIFMPVSKEEVIEALDKNKAIKAVVITSPTYEGYHVKIKEIAEECHKRQAILIVDQAHGAHLGFHDRFLESAVSYADITVQSFHKTLPALTQTAVMHIKGDRVDLNRVRNALDIFETSSPSYVLMKSVSKCMDLIEEKTDIFQDYVDKLDAFYEACGNLKNIKIVKEKAQIKDPGKLVILTIVNSMTGVELAGILSEKYQIETELSSFNYVLAMTSIMDSRRGFERLAIALKEIDEDISKSKNEEVKIIDIANKEKGIEKSINLKPKKVMELYEAKAKDYEVIKIRKKQDPNHGKADDLNDYECLGMEKAKGRISYNLICIYPPGSPIVAPGEEITEEVINLLKAAKETGLHITGLYVDEQEEGLLVVK